MNADLKKVFVIINPNAGTRQARRFLPEIISVFNRAGYFCTVYITEKRGDAAAFAREHAGGADLVAACGGDGTLNEVITGLLLGGHKTPLGYIPCGSTNDFAVSRALSTDILTAARQAASGKQKQYDIGLFGDQYFSYVAAFGAFSWLSYTTDQNLKNVLGHTAYILDGIKDLSRIKPLHVKMTVDGTVYEDDYLFGAVCNSTSIAGTLELPASLVNTCDGLFEVLLIKVPKTLLDLDLIIRGLLTQDYSSPFIVLTQGRVILAENPPDLVWALDGESSTPCEKVRITPVPSFLTLQS